MMCQKIRRYNEWIRLVNMSSVVGLTKTLKCVISMVELSIQMDRMDQGMDGKKLSHKETQCKACDKGVHSLV